MFFFFLPLPQLIEDAAACHKNIMQAVDVVKRDPEVTHWKAFFDSFAEDAARLKGDYKDLFKMELTSLMRQFVWTQWKGGEPVEAHSSTLRQV